MTHVVLMLMLTSFSFLANLVHATDCPYGNSIPVFSTCDFRLALQNDFSEFDLSPFGMNNDAWEIGGLKGIYYPDQPSIDVRDRVINAFAMRVKVARELMPNARLSLYQTGVFSANGSNQTSDNNRLESYLHAGNLGLYDDLDILSPVVYIRYGPTDFASQEEFLSVIEKYTRNTIERSQQLRKSDGSALPLAPHLSVDVLGGTQSPHEGELDDPIIDGIPRFVMSWPMKDM